MIVDAFSSIDQLNAAIIACERCPRLRSYCRSIAQQKRRAFRDDDYWGRPVPGFGDPQARLLIVGLAPAAHGANRTGDRSGDFLYAALQRAGFANQTASIARVDGLRLSGAYITAAARCAPPANKPTPDELVNCRSYLLEELRLLKHVHAILALGKIAFEDTLRALEAYGLTLPRPRSKFGHDARYRLGDYTLLASYHPSQRNTQTGLLTPTMFDRVLQHARQASGM
jgi:uracil-DNA glycosylase family 4